MESSDTTTSNIIYNNNFKNNNGNNNANINNNINNTEQESMELKEQTNNSTTTKNITTNNNSNTNNNTITTNSNTTNNDNTTNIKIKRPRRIVYYGDGPREEYSSDEEEEEEEEVDQTPQTWPSYIISILDSAGERLAYMLGITSPKYQYAIDEHYRRIKEEKEDKEFAEREQAAWEEIVVIQKGSKDSKYAKDNGSKDSKYAKDNGSEDCKYVDKADGNLAVISASGVIVHDRMVVDGGGVVSGGVLDGGVLGGVVDGGVLGGVVDGSLSGGTRVESGLEGLGRVNDGYCAETNKF